MEVFEAHHLFSNCLDEMMSQFNQVIQLFNLEYFNKTDQTDRHEQEVNIYNPA